jgi:hypothetical protein
MERRIPAKRRRVVITLAVLAAAVAGLYAVTLLRFGAMLGGAP